jgi:predicted DNA-binding transcriptional regulator YafY
VNRTDRLYALVEELRAVAPRPRSARWLAVRFAVDARTIRRDIDALQMAGVPIYAEVGRRGGYTLDKRHTLPPINITPRELVAAAVALEALADTPFLEPARSVLHKLLAAMPPPAVAAARELAGRVFLAVPAAAPGVAPSRQVLATVEAAVASGAVLAIDYIDRNGVASHRAVEPLGLAGGAEAGWFLVAWCRLRGAVREFRLDRVGAATPTREAALRRAAVGAGRIAVGAGRAAVGAAPGPAGLPIRRLSLPLPAKGGQDGVRIR